MPKDLKQIVSNAFVVMVFAFGLILLFGAPIINGFVAWCRAMGAN